MSKVQATCACCGETFWREAGALNRAARRGAPVYCGSKCAGKARRTGKSKAQKVAEKAEYDRAYREKNEDKLKVQRAAYYQRTKDPEKERIARKKRAHIHAEYCRRPEYKAWKREYDRRHRAEKTYGEFADCFLLVQDIRSECLAQSSDYEIRLDGGTLNKSQQRRRDYDRTHSNSPEAGPLGNIERSAQRG